MNLSPKYSYHTFINNSSKILYIIIFFTMILENNCEFLTIKKISSSGDYFVVFNDGLYLYDSNLIKNSRVFTFNNNQKIGNTDNFIISDLINNNQTYIICLIKKYLYVYDDSQKKIVNTYYLDKLSNSDYNDEKFYNMIIYDVKNNNLEFCIILLRDFYKFLIKKHKITFLHYNINILGSTVNKPNEKDFEGDEISDYKFSCKKDFNSFNSRCFYCRDWQKYFSYITFDTNYNAKSVDIKKMVIYDIIQSKFSISYNNKHFACFLKKDNQCICYMDNLSDTFVELNSCNQQKCEEFETYYYSETNEFALICKYNNKYNISLFNNNDTYNVNQICYNKMFIVNCSSLKYYSLIYNNFTNDYNIITNCNFTNQLINNNVPLEENMTEIITEDNDIASEGISEEYDKNYKNDGIDEETKSEENKVDYIIDINDYDLNEFINLPKNEVEENLKNIISKAEIGKNYEIKGNGFTINIRPTNSSSSPNSTYVEFDECEKILRKKYNISNSSILSFLQFELNNDNPQSLINQVEYLTYTDKKEILDLSLCKDVDIQIHHSIKDDIFLDIESISSFNDQGIDIFNINDSFFNDICYSYSNSSNDIILEDRKKDIYQNYSLCEEGCTYNNTDIANMIITCDCKVKQNISNDIASLNNNIVKETYIFDSNIEVAKCYKLVFSLDGKLNNYGFWIFVVSIIINIILIILYFFNGIKSVLDYIFNEMVSKGYLKRNAQKFFQNNNNSQNKIFHPIKKNNNENKGKNIIIKNKKKAKRKRKLNIKIFKIKNEEQISSRIKFKSNKYNLKKFNTKMSKNINQEHNNDIKNNFSLIKIDLNNIRNYFPEDSYQTLHNYTFEEAIKYDRRSIFKIFYIYLINKQIIFHTFLQKNPLELLPLRICVFIFMLSTDLALNSLLYLKDNISKKYKYSKGLFLFTFSNNLTIILLSTLLSFIFISLISKLGNSTNAIRNVFRKEEDKIIKNKNYRLNEKRKKKIFLEIENILRKFKIKLIMLIIIQIILILFYWYFVTAFCHVYSKTQISWLLDSFLSFLSRFIIELLFALFFSKLYIVSVESHFYYLYRVLLFIYDFT